MTQATWCVQLSPGVALSLSLVVCHISSCRGMANMKVGSNQVGLDADLFTRGRPGDADKRGESMVRCLPALPILANEWLSWKMTGWMG